MAQNDEGVSELERYEEEILERMYDAGIIGMAYKATERVRRVVNWDELQRTYEIKKKFERVLRHLYSKGYVDFHGKGGDVASLTRLGVLVARSLKKEREKS